MVALSAIVAAVESVLRLFQPQPLSNLGWVLAAGLIWFAGNEIVAMYRIRVGKEIGSAALVADGVHARTVESAVAHVAPAESTVKLRWSGHRLHVEVSSPNAVPRDGCRVSFRQS